MTTEAFRSRDQVLEDESRSFEAFASICAILAGSAGFLYAVAFIIVQRSNPNLGGLLSALFLLLLGLFSSAALVGVYDRLRLTEPSFALWALLLGLAGAFGAMVHGGYDLANAVNPPAANPVSATNLPSQIDPRGLLAFCASGIALFAMSWLIQRGGRLPSGLGYVGYLSAVLLVILYLGRLIILDPASPVIAIPAVLNGFIVNPIFYIWVGLALRRREQREKAVRAAAA